MDRLSAMLTAMPPELNITMTRPSNYYDEVREGKLQTLAIVQQVAIR